MGKRNFYIISYSSQFYRDEINLGTVYITQNLKEAEQVFRALYELVKDDYRNDEGEIWAEHNFDFSTNEQTSKTRGIFNFYEDEGMCTYQLNTLHTNVIGSSWHDEIENTRWDKSLRDMIGAMQDGTR